MLDCFKRSAKKSQSKNTHTMTIINYLRDGIPHAIMANGGPGGSVTLSEEEYQAIVKEVDVPIYTGASAAELTGQQVLDSEAFKQILQKKEADRSALQSPRSISNGFKRKS